MSIDSIRSSPFAGAHCAFTKRDGTKCGYKVKCDLRCQYHVGKDGFLRCGGDNCKALTASRYGFCAPCGLKNRNQVQKNKIIQGFMELKTESDVQFNDLLKERIHLKKRLEVIEEDLKEIAFKMMTADERCSPIDELISEVVLMNESDRFAPFVFDSQASTEDAVKQSGFDSTTHN